MDLKNERLPARDLAVRIAQSASIPERDALNAWVSRLLQVRASSGNPAVKAKDALAATMDRHLLWPALRTIAREIRRLGWDERGAAARVGLLGAAAAIALSGSGAVSIAALGTTVGVPLWIVFGGRGGTFAKALQEELELRGAPLSGGATYKVLEADKLP
ncbi:hypothetical protein [Terrihabitans rhizophilus]|jgi:hypothetical protein|uniref:Uncharacterized protein n=1 Tax=Terrihabitans rhizophilus TaxID=3092662 RepID=A0ABU4RL27_9HYPH|nr:hypothetical protein [Terrihabitans sp. PJ23]MDX6804913.1 hypothetical protein [Terrihabitans sp. PJ23]